VVAAALRAEHDCRDRGLGAKDVGVGNTPVRRETRFVADDGSVRVQKARQNWRCRIERTPWLVGPPVVVTSPPSGVDSLWSWRRKMTA
jgi:hypothetical protein